MKRKILSRLFLCSIFLSAPLFAHAQDPNFHIYICFGQSNMEGQGPIEAQDKTVDSRFQIMQAVSCTGQPAGKWRTATPPLARCNTNLGPPDYFGREMVKNLPSNVKVGIVFVAIAGCKIELFDKVNYASYSATAASWMQTIIAAYGGNPYAKIVELSKIAQKDGVIKGILLHQGESNVGDQQWATKVKGVYNNLLTDLNLSASNVPLLAGQVVDAAAGGICAGANTLIDNLPKTIPTSYVISSSGLKAGSDNLHFTSASYRTLGIRYATKMLSLLPPSCATLAPTVSATSLSYEVGDVAKQLSATGTSLKWYVGTSTTAQTSAPTPSTSIAGVTTYSVTQTANGCESARTTITVTVSNTYKIYKTNTPIVIDGTIESIWNSSAIVDASLAKVLSGTISNSSDLSAKFKTLWDNTYLYILGDVTDQTLTNDSPNWYDDDAVEVYLDINNDKATSYGANDVQYTFGWNDGTTLGASPSGRSTSNVSYKMTGKTGGYIFEARIPWSTLQATPALNQFVGIDFMVNDDDNGGTRDKKIAWTSTTDNAYQDPSLFGVAKLMGEPVTTGTEDFNVSFDGLGVRCFPNPFTSEFMIEAKGRFSYQMMNQLGQIVESYEVNEKTILSKEYPKGVYLIKIIQEGKTSILKMVKE